RSSFRAGWAARTVATTWAGHTTHGPKARRPALAGRAGPARRCHEVGRRGVGACEAARRNLFGRDENGPRARRSRSRSLAPRPRGTAVPAIAPPPRLTTDVPTERFLDHRRQTEHRTLALHAPDDLQPDRQA